MRRMGRTATSAGMIVLAASSVMLSGTDAHADQALTFRATLTGAQEVPPVDSDSVGFATVRFDRGFTRADVFVRVRGDIEVVAAHFHCARPGENGTIPFGLFNPGQLTDFTNDERVRLTNADFTGDLGAGCLLPPGDASGTVPVGIGRPVNNIAALAHAMQEGLIYLNLHSPTALGGEIRGQMLPVPAVQ